jgi:hypothetical protein
MRKSITAAVAASLCFSTAATAAPVASAAPAASKLSLGSNVRAHSSAKRSSKLAGAGIAVALGVVGIVAGGVIVGVRDDDSPDSN